MFNRKPVPDPRFTFGRKKKRFPAAQIEEVASYLASESSVQAARMEELVQAGIDTELIKEALAKLHSQERHRSTKTKES